MSSSQWEAHKPLVEHTCNTGIAFCKGGFLQNRETLARHGYLIDIYQAELTKVA